MSHPDVSLVLPPLPAFTADSGEAQLKQAVWVLGQLAEAAGVEFDPGLSESALRQSLTEDVATRPESWLERLEQAGRVVGLQVITGQGTIGEALRLAKPAVPLAVYIPSIEGAARWLLLYEEKRGRVRVKVGEAGGKDSWLDWKQLAASFGAAHDSHTLSWVTAQPLILGSHLSGVAQYRQEGPSPFRRLIGLLWVERRDLWLILAFTITISVLYLTIPLAVEMQFEFVRYGTVLQPVIVLAILLLVFLGLDAAVKALRTFVVEILQRRLLARVVSELAYRLPRVRCQVYEGEHGAEIGNRFFDVFTLQKASATLLLDGLTLVIQTVVSLFVLAVYHPYLLGFDVILVVTVTFLIFVLGWGAIDRVIDQSIAKYELAGWLEEMTRRPIAFKLTSGPRYAFLRANRLTRDFLLTREQFFRVLFRQITFALGLQAVAGVSLLALGSWLVIRGQLTYPQLLAAELIVAVLIDSFTKLGKSMESYYDLMASMDKLGQLVDLPLEREGGEELAWRAGGMSLSTHQLYFRHDRRGQPAFPLQNWSVTAGQRVAILGPGGSGKTTLVELLLGLREPTQGYIEVDGINLGDARLESLRQQIGAVTNPQCFNTTILENVRMERSHISLAQTRESLERVGLLADVMALPQGLHTELTLNGSPLSGQQVTQVVIARAIVGRPRLLLLDGVLDALDEPTRQRLLAGLLDRSMSWTVVLTTRLAEVAAHFDHCIRLGEKKTATHEKSRSVEPREQETTS